MFLKDISITHCSFGEEYMVKGKRILVILVLLGVLVIQLFGLSATGSTVVFHPTDDTMINQAESPNSVFGELSYMVVRNAYGNTGTNTYEISSLLKFDVLTLPSTAIISSALLNLYYYNSSGSNAAGRTINLYRLTSSWTEETVRWNTKPSVAVVAASSSTVPELLGQWMTWDVTDEVQYYVQERAVYGWMITDKNAWEQANIPTMYFRTKEHGNYIPYLQVSFSVPEEPPGLLCGFSISPLAPAIGETVQFTDTSYVSNGTIVSWLWNFGDGNYSTSKSPAHTYSHSGLYTVTLQVTDQKETPGSMTTTLSVSPSKSTPGFEGILVICAVVAVLYLKRHVWRK